MPVSAQGRSSAILLAGHRRHIRDRIAVPQADQAHALRDAPRAADVRDVHANHDAVLRNDHEVVRLTHAPDGNERPGLLRDVHGQDALSATRDAPVILHGAALAVAVGADRQDVPLLSLYDDHAHQVCVLQPHAAYALRVAAHGAGIALVETDGEALR